MMRRINVSVRDYWDLGNKCNYFLAGRIIIEIHLTVQVQGVSSGKTSSYLCESWYSQPIVSVIWRVLKK